MCSVVSMLSDERNFLYSLICVLTISVFWTCNISLWTFDSIKYYVLTDTAFTVGMFTLYRISGLRWVGILSLLYSMNVVLDILQFTNTIAYEPFAFWSNRVFEAQLLLSSHRGWWTIIKWLCRIKDEAKPAL